MTKKKCIGLHVQYSARYSCPILTNLEISRQIFFEKYSNITFHENPSSESPRCSTRIEGQMDARTDGRTGMAKLMVAFRNFATAPNSTQAIGPELANRTLSKCKLSTDELFYTDGTAA